MIQEMRQEVFALCPTRNDFLNYLKSVLALSFNRSANSFKYYVDGKLVCYHAWEAFWNVSYYYRKKIESAIKAGTTLSIPHGNSIRDYTDPKSTLCEQWLHSFCKVCEHQPDSMEIPTVKRLVKLHT